MSNDAFIENLTARYRDRTAVVAVIGLGYVGLPLARALIGAGFKVIGLDIDPEKIVALKAGRTYLRHVSADVFSRAISEGCFHPTTEFSELTQADAILICVPTPLTSHREPDLTFIEMTAQAITPRLRKGQLIVLESTTYPGTTRDVLKLILEKSNLTSGKDFFIAYSPEREDPGNIEFSTNTIPKVVGGDGPDALNLANALYSAFVPRTVLVSSPETAEAVKLTENIFRSVNIALVNELKSSVFSHGNRCLGGHRGGKNQTFWLHAILSRPGTWRTLHSHRSVLFDVEGARIRPLDALY